MQAEHVVISDVRFPNEAEWIRARRGIVRVLRQGPPIVRQHESESHADSITPDTELLNFGSLATLHDQIDRMVEHRCASPAGATQHEHQARNVLRRRAHRLKVCATAARVDDDTGCWHWGGATQTKPVSMGGKVQEPRIFMATLGATTTISRAAWLLSGKPVPPGRALDSVANLPQCVVWQPAHGCRHQIRMGRIKSSARATCAAGRASDQIHASPRRPAAHPEAWMTCSWSEPAPRPCRALAKMLQTSSRPSADGRRGETYKPLPWSSVFNWMSRKRCRRTPSSPRRAIRGACSRASRSPTWPLPTCRTWTPSSGRRRKTRLGHRGVHLLWSHVAGPAAHWCGRWMRAQLGARHRMGGAVWPHWPRVGFSGTMEYQAAKVGIEVMDELDRVSSTSPPPAPRATGPRRWSCRLSLEGRSGRRPPMRPAAGRRMTCLPARHTPGPSPDAGKMPRTLTPGTARRGRRPSRLSSSCGPAPSARPRQKSGPCCRSGAARQRLGVERDGCGTLCQPAPPRSEVGRQSTGAVHGVRLNNPFRPGGGEDDDGRPRERL